MEVQYRKLFLKDLKKLKGQPVYEQVFNLAFTILPKVNKLRDVADVKIMRSSPNRYRIRIGNYRVGVELRGKTVEMMRALHRQEFYRYFP
ncbi:MAG: type II toxin-antitoxin system RelE/ParE family toxin [bacterium]|nr:type II toxin-antitoxin system RelE/ParE family toxin [bacterium]